MINKFHWNAGDLSPINETTRQIRSIAGATARQRHLAVETETT